MSTLEKIKSLLSNQKTKLYAELKLDDGRVVATEDEQFMIGSEVMVIGDDGEATPLSAGSYTMSDGAKMSVDDNSKITDLGEEKEAEDVDAKKKEEYAEDDDESPAEKADWAKSYEELKDRVEELEKAVFDKEDMANEEVKEELAEESTTAVVEEKIEMSVDIITSLVEEVEELKSKLMELEKQPGAEGFTHTPENDTTYKEVDLTKLSSTERAAHYINNLK
jgi:hypothetical protein